jgi:hypothetical protein
MMRFLGARKSVSDLKQGEHTVAERKAGVSPAAGVAHTLSSAPSAVPPVCPKSESAYGSTARTVTREVNGQVNTWFARGVHLVVHL